MAELSKTPSSKRRDMYKKTTPTWRDTYRKRCFERLRSSRESLLQRFRGCTSPEAPSSGPKQTGFIGSPNPRSPGLFVSRVMDEEWKLLKHEDPTFGLIEDEMDMRYELQEELMKEELSIIAEYESSLRLEEEHFQATVGHYTSASVVCPVCQRNSLLLNKGIVFCPCGLRIDTQQDCINLSNISENLEHGISQHSSMCAAIPSFAPMDLGDVHNLVMSCDVCGFLHIII